MVWRVVVLFESHAHLHASCLGSGTIGGASEESIGNEKAYVQYVLFVFAEVKTNCTGTRNEQNKKNDCQQTKKCLGQGFAVITVMR